MDGYELAKEANKLKSQTGKCIVSTSIDLDVLSIGELKSKQIAFTDDLGKYNYTTDEDDQYSNFFLIFKKNIILLILFCIFENEFYGLY